MPIRESSQIERATDRVRCDPCARSGPVDQRQSLLRLRRERRQIELRKQRVGVEYLAAKVHHERGVEAEHRTAYVGKRDQVAASADSSPVGRRVGSRRRSEKWQIAR